MHYFICLTKKKSVASSVCWEGREHDRAVCVKDDHCLPRQAISEQSQVFHGSEDLGYASYTWFVLQKDRSIG